MNEKKRREQENIYMEELAEMVSHHTEPNNFTTNKPDKCAILEETLNTIKRFNESEGKSTPLLFLPFRAFCRSPRDIIHLKYFMKCFVSRYHIALINYQARR